MVLVEDWHVEKGDVQELSAPKEASHYERGTQMTDWHRKPPATVRSVSDALRDADRMKRDLPRVVQVRASDWDKVILADELDRLRRILEWNNRN